MIGIDKEYQARFEENLLRMILETSMAEGPNGGRVAYLRSYELIDAMLTTIAFLSSTSAATATPAKTRKFCDEMARKIQRRIAEAKLLPSPFETINPEMLS